MQEQTPSEPNGGEEWLARLREELDERAAVISKTLSDVRVSGVEPTTWVDRRSDAKMSVYIVSPGMLHRLRGDLEPKPKPEEFSVKCEYEAVPITPDAGYSLVVTQKERPNHAGVISRQWTFKFPAFDTIVAEAEYTETGTLASLGPDPTPFAEALADEIDDERKRRRERGAER